MATGAVLGVADICRMCRRNRRRGCERSGRTGAGPATSTPTRLQRCQDRACARPRRQSFDMAWANHGLFCSHAV